MESYYERFRRLNPPLFEGGSDPMATEIWIREMEKMFDALQYSENMKVRLAVPMLKGNAEFWWTAIKAAYRNNDDQLTWKEFKEIFYDQYFPETMRLVKENEFLALKQKDDMTVLEYANKFNKLGRFCSQLMEFERSKANRFEQGLRYGIRSRLSFHIFNNYKNVLERTLKVKSELKRVDLERGDKKRSRLARYLKDQQKNFKNNNSDKKKEFSSCSYCEKNHNGPCLKRIGACFLCGEKGHMARDEVQAEQAQVNDEVVDDGSESSEDAISLEELSMESE
ncbi:uncharacterized protein [Elaeis guineensis]|uniref:uncharacterized protein n=1 Tax=Elaeis guineensis var. tenera TaxID=51953 RepID=UPI003C6D3FDD